MPWLRLSLPILLLLSLRCNAQFAELAGLATSFLGPGLGGALEGASAGAGALGQIGQFYQLAQAGIGLAGTGVDVLNKASQGNWFPAVIEQATLMQKNMGANGGSGVPGGLGGLGGALGALGGLPGLGGGGGGTNIGSEFGTSFPAPSVEDYETEIDLKGTTTPKQGLERFFTSTTTQEPELTTAARSIPITLFPEEEDKDEHFKPSVKSLPKRKINIILPKSPDYFEGKSTDTESEIEFKTEKDRDYDSLITKAEEVSEVSSNTVKERATRSEKEKIIDLERLIEVLSKNKMKDDEIAEIIKQVESNAGRSEQTRHKDDFDSTVKNISPDMFEKQQRIIKATRDLREHLDTQQKEREQLLSAPEPSSSTESSTTPPTYYPFVTTTNAPTPSSFAEFETTTKPTRRPVLHSTPSLPLPFPSIHQPWSPPPPSASSPFSQVPLSSPSSSSSSFLYPSQLYSVSGQAIPPVQIVHPFLSKLPSYPYQLPSSQSQFSQVALPSIPAPPPSPSSLSSLPTYYTYQNANSHTVTRGTVQLPVSSIPSRVTASGARGRRVRQGAGAATDPRVAAAATRTTVAPVRTSLPQTAPHTQQEVSAAVRRRFKGRGEGMSGRPRRVEGNHAERRPAQVRAQAAKSHRIFASPISTVSPSSSFPRRMVATQPLTTPSPVRHLTPISSSNHRQASYNQPQFVVSAESRSSSPSRTLVTPYWIDSNFIQRFPQQAQSSSATGDDLVRAEITATNERMEREHQQLLNGRRMRPDEYRELQARLRQYSS